MRFTAQSLFLKGRFYGVRRNGGWMGPRTSLDALNALAGKKTVICQFFILYSNLKIVRNVLSGLQLKKKNERMESKHT
jgi:hypothetical protein